MNRAGFSGGSIFWEDGVHRKHETVFTGVARAGGPASVRPEGEVALVSFVFVQVLEQVRNDGRDVLQATRRLGLLRFSLESALTLTRGTLCAASVAVAGLAQRGLVVLAYPVVVDTASEASVAIFVNESTVTLAARTVLELHRFALYHGGLRRSGHVYVLSNVGSFGEGIYKIGMTRRSRLAVRARRFWSDQTTSH